MYRELIVFFEEWGREQQNTAAILARLRDHALDQRVAPGYRTLSRIAWHIVQSLVEIMQRMDVRIDGPGEDAPVPGSAAEIRQAYDTAARDIVRKVGARWTDDTLRLVDHMYGEEWRRGETLAVMLRHEIHHRGQMSVLMRQAGLDVANVYGPTLEEWAEMKMKPPAV
jgi:uncharacterized damage-inducible protein DinB